MSVARERIDAGVKVSSGGLVTTWKTSSVAVQRPFIAADVVINYLKVESSLVVPVTDTAPFKVEPLRFVAFHPLPSDEDARRGMCAIMNPIIEGLYAPLHSSGNGLAAIAIRTVVPNKGKAVPEYSSFLANKFAQFARLIIPDEYAHQAHLATHEEVVDHQDGVGRTKAMEMVDGPVFDEDETLYASVKDELAQKLRYFVPMSKEKKHNLTRALLGMRTFFYERGVLSRQTRPESAVFFSASGVTHRHLEQYVCEMMQKAQFITQSDFSAFDGSQTAVCRELVDVILRRAFCDEAWDEMKPWLRAMHGNRIQLLGSVLEQWHRRMSGEPFTSDGNTFLTAFTLWLARTFDGHSSEEAFEGLGIFMGDDTISDDVRPESVQRAADIMGFNVEVSIVQRGDPATFCGRLYYGWYGDCSSMTDPVRALSKYHATASKSAVAESIIAAKAYAYLQTDRNTPHVGPLVRELFRQTQAFLDPQYLAYRARDFAPTTLGAGFELSDAAPENTPGAWMDEYFANEVPDFDWELLDMWAETRGHYMTVPCIGALPLKVQHMPRQIDDMYIPGEDPEYTAEEAEADLKDFNKQARREKKPRDVKKPDVSKTARTLGVKPRCRHFAAGRCTFGSKCRFAHDDGSETASTSGASSAGSTA
jgi:hypothetical protein